MHSFRPVSLSLVASGFYSLRWCEIDQFFPLQADQRAMRREPDSQTSVTDGEAIDVAAVKEVLLFTSLTLLRYGRKRWGKWYLEQRMDEQLEAFDNVHKLIPFFMSGS